MTESEFTQIATAIFDRIEKAFDNSDIECSPNGPVLEIEFDDGSQIIINRHSPNQEIWIAAKSGGFHYALQDEQWLSKRDDSELFSKLKELIALGSGQSIEI